MYELSGTLAGTGLPAVLRFLAELCKTGCLHVGTPAGAGQVYLDAGRVTSAVLGHHDGLSALEQIMARADDAAFSFEATPLPQIAPTIDLDLESLLRHLETVAVNGAAMPIESLAVSNGAVHGPGHCPALGFEDDQANSFNRPTRLHRCFATDKPAPLTLEQQRDLCLTDGYPNCPRLQPIDTARGGYGQIALRTPANGSTALVRGEGPSTDILAGATWVAGTNGTTNGHATTNGTHAFHGNGAYHEPAVHGQALTIEAAPRSTDPAHAPTELDGGVAYTQPPRRRGAPRRLIALLVLLVLLVVLGIVVAVMFVRSAQTTAPPSAPIATPGSAQAAAQQPATGASAAGASAGATSSAPPSGAAIGSETSPQASPPNSGAPAGGGSVTQPITPPVTQRVILDERFANPSSLPWPNTSNGPAQLVSGTYVVQTRTPGQFVALGVPMPQIFEDVTVSATFHKAGGPPGGGFGLILRDQAESPHDGIEQNGHFYVLEVGDRGEVGIWRREDERWIDLVPWQAAAAVNTGSGTNEIIARAAGTHLTLSVNGVQVATRDDPTYRAGTVGLFVGGDGNVVSLDRFTIQQP